MTGLFPVEPSRVTKSIKLEPNKVFQTCSSGPLATSSPGGQQTPVSPVSVSASNNTTMMTSSAVDISSQTTSPSVTSQSLDSSPEEQSGDPAPLQSSPNNDPAPVSTNGHPETPVEATIVAQPSLETADHGTPAHNEGNQDSVSPAETENHVDAWSSSTCVNNKCQSSLVAQLKQTPSSPFSKYPSTPTSSTKKRKAPVRPKAITGHEYRRLLQEKREKKERGEQEKLRTKEERINKMKMKEEQTKSKKQIQLERKRILMQKRRQNEKEKDA